MALYLRATLRSFVEGLEKTSNLTFPAIELTHLISPEEMDYALDLLRESIGLYEERKGIPAARSKRKIPFFRQGSRMLVGPELGCYVIPLWERSEEVPASEAPCLLLELDYPSLGELCLWENYSLVACKYDRDAFLKHFAAYWRRNMKLSFSMRNIRVSRPILASFRS